MDLILWRHAEAEDGLPDKTRKLTAKGEQQARDMATWLKRRLPKDVRVLCSDATRAIQTAGALSEAPQILRSLGVGANSASLLAAAGWPDNGTVVLVGHQPTLGQVAALLLGGEEQDWTIKKGAVWWISNRVRQGDAQTVLRVMMTPDML
jgi:phosphohistidine phosphatase